MIYPGPLTPEQQARSRRYFHKFNFLNGVSYTCLGETIIILFAVRIDCPDVLIAILGSMVYFGYLLLPLGKFVTSRVGAVQSQSTFWVARNLAALLVASTSLLVTAGWRVPAMIILMTGAFLFYGFRAAGVIMSQPLIGDLTTDRNRARFLGTNTLIFQSSSLIMLLVISLLLHENQSLWLLTAIMVFGACIGITSANVFRKIDETEAIRESSRKSLHGAIATALRNPRYRSYLKAIFLCNLMNILIAPMSMLTLKRGYGISDTGALLFTLLQIVSSIIMSQLAGILAAKIGPRKVIIAAFAALMIPVVLWIISPPEMFLPLTVLPFVVIGSTSVAFNNSGTHYFLQAVPAKNRVGAAILNAVLSGAGAGAAGMVLAGGLIRLAGALIGENSFAVYRLYFIFVLLLLIPCFLQILRLRHLRRKTAEE